MLNSLSTRIDAPASFHKLHQSAILGVTWGVLLAFGLSALLGLLGLAGIGGGLRAVLLAMALTELATARRQDPESGVLRCAQRVGLLQATAMVLSLVAMGVLAFSGHPQTFGINMQILGGVSFAVHLAITLVGHIGIRAWRQGDTK